MYNKKSSVFRFALCTKKSSFFFLFLCILLHDFYEEIMMGTWNKDGLGCRALRQK